MRSVRGLLLGLAALVGLWIGWGAYVSRTTERVPSDTIGSVDGVELRRYPRTVRAETTAPDARAAFRRLYRYISGENERREEVAMTTPVTVRGTTISMTAPVRTSAGGDDGKGIDDSHGSDDDDSGDRSDGSHGSNGGDRSDDVTMAFYLPQTYTAETAPTPTDPDVRLIVDPPRTVAVRRFSWYATDDPVDRSRRRLLEGWQVSISSQLFNQTSMLTGKQIYY